MIVPFEKIDPELLRSLVEEFVSREGTEYGSCEFDLESKTKQVVRQLEKGSAVITFNPEDESFSIVSALHLANS